MGKLHARIGAQAGGWSLCPAVTPPDDERYDMIDEAFVLKLSCRYSAITSYMSHQLRHLSIHPPNLKSHPSLLSAHISTLHTYRNHHSTYIANLYSHRSHHNSHVPALCHHRSPRYTHVPILNAHSIILMTLSRIARQLLRVHESQPTLRVPA